MWINFYSEESLKSIFLRQPTNDSRSRFDIQLKVTIQDDNLQIKNEVSAHFYQFVFFRQHSTIINELAIAWTSDEWSNAWSLSTENVLISHKLLIKVQ